MRYFLYTLAGFVVLLAASTSLLTVEASEYVYVTQFGRPVRTYDGASAAGLHAKLPWPIESAIRLDRRLQVFDLPATELLTHDPEGRTIDKTLTVSAYVCWRIDGSGGADRFIRTVGRTDRAEAILGQRISSRLGALIGSMNMDDLISIAPLKTADERMNALSRRVMDGDPANRDGATAGLRTYVAENYGIELVDVRVRKLSYPPQVREAIYDRIRSERYKKVADYQSEGAMRAENIRTQGEFQARTILAEAKAADRRIRGVADAAADRVRSEAYERDPGFYAFLKKLEDYQKILGDNKTLLLLSSQRELFDLLLKPPGPQPAGPRPQEPMPAKPANKTN